MVAWIVGALIVIAASAYLIQNRKALRHYREHEKYDSDWMDRRSWIE